MDDQKIIDLYWQRSESAISETDAKYGKFCYGLAMNVLSNREDAEESVSDTYLAAWNALPPNRPTHFMAFLGKLTRRIAIDHWRRDTRKKRGGSQVPLCLEELKDCASPSPDMEEIAIGREAHDALKRFLEALPQTERRVFVRRYFFLDPVAEIGKEMGYTEAKVTSMLHRTRKKLAVQFRKEGYL